MLKVYFLFLEDSKAKRPKLELQESDGCNSKKRDLYGTAGLINSNMSKSLLPLKDDLVDDVENDESQDEYEEDSDSDSEVVICKPKQVEYPYEVLDRSSILSCMNDTIEKVTSVIQVSAPNIRILLQYFKWDKEKLLEAFYTSDQGKLFEVACIATKGNRKINLSQSSDQQSCVICLTEVPIIDMRELDCGHRFCVDCVAEYVTNKIVNEAQATISCPEMDCTIIMGDDRIQSLITDSSVLDNYRNLLETNFVSYNRHMKWCPAPGCSYAIRYKKLTPVY